MCSIVAPCVWSSVVTTKLQTMSGAAHVSDALAFAKGTTQMIQGTQQLCLKVLHLILDVRPTHLPS